MNLIKFFIDQHGCAKNQVDGELIIANLEKAGYKQTFNSDEAQLIIINSCGFIESAKQECLEAVFSARQQYPKAKILLAGCLAERYGNDLNESLPEVDGFFGNGDISEISNVVTSIFNDKKTVVIPPQKGVCCGDRKMFLAFPGSAFVKITEGCNNRCSFCAIPIIRGELRSRNSDEIIKEIKELVRNGIYEINLIGQDLAAYGTGAEDNVFGTGRTYLPNGTPGIIENSIKIEKKESGLCTLLKRISELEGTFVVRLLYIHPDHFNEDILPVMKADSRFLPYFDIPFQSGDDKIIKDMHRVGTKKKYSELIESIRVVFPEAAIRTTFLAGFPGETEEAAENTLNLLKDIKTDWSGCFPYSREEDTPAYDLKPRVNKKIAQQRADNLVSIQAEITKDKLSSRCGKEYDILIEEVLAENADFPDEGFAIGRAWFQAPEVDGSVVVRFDRSEKNQVEAVKPGRLVKVKIISSGDVDLNGDFICDSPLNSSIKPNKYSFAQQNA